jgi:hypothetical protein
VAVIAFSGHLWLRLSAQAYNRTGDYTCLADAVIEIIGTRSDRTQGGRSDPWRR